MDAFQRLISVAIAACWVLLSGCGDRPDLPAPGLRGALDVRMLEPPSQAAGEPHAFDRCPDGACPRDEAGYLFSGEFHERVVDLRVRGCTVGLDLVWARRYRSRLGPAAGRSPLGNNWDHSYNIYAEL
ncbi:DUF6531 domain-containing protein, partial [Enhygromyxa salina]|uniref:DUF6531 domain-containing protein n=1 Tax=Enhygromyxa salina TaxID=215803 RepID=UPI0011BA8517